MAAFQGLSSIKLVLPEIQGLESKRTKIMRAEFNSESFITQATNFYLETR
jgi:hypothetical protein